jgi:hypothetical protein
MMSAELQENVALLRKYREEDASELSNIGVTTERNLDGHLRSQGMSDVVPGAFRAWLVAGANGVDLRWGTLYGIGPGVRAMDAVERYRLVSTFEQARLFPLGQDGGGNDYVADLSRLTPDGEAPVLFTESSAKWRPQYIVASSIQRFIRFFLLDHGCLDDEDLRWPFDRAYLLQHDPEISGMGYRLPGG